VPLKPMKNKAIRELDAAHADADGPLQDFRCWVEKGSYGNFANLRAEDGLRQSDLPEVGSQGVVSEVLAGKRKPNARQVKALAQRFRVAAEVLLP